MAVAKACSCVRLSRSAYYRHPDDWTVRDAEIIAGLAKLVEGGPSRGFWKCRKLLRRQGRAWNHKRIYQVYKLMRLNLRRDAKRRLPQRERLPLCVPRRPDSVWSADFMSDALQCGRRYVFETRGEVRQMTAEWITRYKELRTHESLGNLSPRDYLMANST
jgi:putative transposase